MFKELLEPPQLQRRNRKAYLGRVKALGRGDCV